MTPIDTFGIPALTIHQPFAELIARGDKRVENRTWSTAYCGPLLIHAGAVSDYLPAQDLRRYTTGALVALCTVDACLTGFVSTRTGARWWRDDCMPEFAWVEDHEYAQGPVCWVLTLVQRIDPPIPARGLQGLWTMSEARLK